LIDEYERLRSDERESLEEVERTINREILVGCELYSRLIRERQCLKHAPAPVLPQVPALPDWTGGRRDF